MLTHIHILHLYASYSCGVFFCSRSDVCGTHGSLSVRGGDESKEEASPQVSGATCQSKRYSAVVCDICRHYRPVLLKRASTKRRINTSNKRLARPAGGIIVIAILTKYPHSIATRTLRRRQIQAESDAYMHANENFRIYIRTFAHKQMYIYTYVCAYMDRVFTYLHNKNFYFL